MIDFSTILGPPLVTPDGRDVVVSWASSSPEGATFQLYVNRRLAWSGTSRVAVLVARPDAAVYQVGVVPAGEAWANYSASLPAIPGTGDRAKLDWEGGSYLEPTGPGSGLAGFRVYGEASPGGGVLYAHPLGELPAYSAGEETGGWGVGGFGAGGWGAGSGLYTWTSEPLANGTWTFAVVPFDRAGNEGTAATVEQVIANPPAPAARDAAGLRLTYTYDPATRLVTLHWLASPG